MILFILMPHFRKEHNCKIERRKKMRLEIICIKALKAEILQIYIPRMFQFEKFSGPSSGAVVGKITFIL